jgi:UDP-N-acetylmuramate--alanine ligase
VTTARTHFVGVGGIGMSGLARVLAALGENVSGCDRAESPLLDELRAEGVGCATPHDPAHLEGGVTEVVVSTAIDAAEPELVEARRRGLTIRHRSECLAGILDRHAHRIVVSGAHGKTTTSAMLAVALTRLGRDPSFVVGGVVADLGTNARGGRGGICVAEGDESDRSVRRLPADLAVVLNVDLDHLDHYASIGEVEALLQAWIDERVVAGVVVAGDDVALRHPRLRRFGVGPGEGLRALEIEATERGTSFTPSRGAERVELAVPGAHNAGNACAAALVLEELGHPLAEGFAALSTFTGASRRFETVGRFHGALVVDDYAHHPTELAALLAAARPRTTGRLLVYFQPHMPWRTRAFARAFGDALSGADTVIVSETYVARGAADPDVTARAIVERVAEIGTTEAVWAATADDAVEALAARAGPGDLVICAGAGPVDAVARRLVERGSTG